MKKQIVRISILQSSKIATLLYTLLGFIYTLIGIPLLIIGVMKGDLQFEIIGGLYLLGPVFMGLIGFIFFVIAAALYNLAAKFVGGFEVEVRDICVGSKWNPPRCWEYGWEEAKLRQMRRNAARSFRENLIWLEETLEFRKAFARFMGSHPELLALLPKK